MSTPPSNASAGLNLAQQEAVNFMHGPCLVLAGAGSGKTRVITHKIARLIQAGLAPQRIAAITFTNKAASEMRERAKELIGRAAKDVVICTFHALGVRMLRQDGAALGLKPQFSILDSDDVTSILKDAGGTVDAATARSWQWTISLWKNLGLNAERAANNVIGPNPKLFPKNLWSDLGEGEPVRVVDADSEDHEAERTVARIQSLRASFGTPTMIAGQAAAAPGRPKQGTAPSGGSAGREATSVGVQEWRHFAVLDRANHQAKPFEKALRKANIPYKVSGGTSFFDRAEIKDLCAWFRLWINNNDDPAFLRAVTTPKRGIGHQTLSQLGRFASSRKVSLFEALFSGSLGSVMGAKALGSLHEFGRYVNDLEFRARHTVGAEAAGSFLCDWLKEIDYQKHLYDGEDSEKLAAARWTNVIDFCDWMSARCGGTIADAAGVTTVNEPKTLLEVAQTVSLLSTISEREADQDVVTLSTLHAAKGLEWPHVILVGVNEGLLPFKLSDGAASSGGSVRADEAVNEDIATRLQEERRLMYVGITRAQRSLAVSWTRKRKKGREMVAAQPSRFIAEMALDQATVREDPREKLRALRAEFAKKAQDKAAAQT